MSDQTLHNKLVNIQQKLKAPKSNTNNSGSFTFSYRSCEDILEAVKPLLDGLVLTISDEIISVGDKNYIEATAILSDGKIDIRAKGIAREPDENRAMSPSQITGSTSSYARKYALNGLFAIDDTKDADTMDNAKKEEKVTLSPSKPLDTPPGGKCSECNAVGSHAPECSNQ